MSKGLEALQDLMNGKHKIHNYYVIRKELKALEIIKKRLIDIQDIVLYKTFSSFNQRRTLRGLLPIPKKEYDLLKEVLL